MRWLARSLLGDNDAQFVIQMHHEPADARRVGFVEDEAAVMVEDGRLGPPFRRLQLKQGMDDAGIAEGDAMLSNSFAVTVSGVALGEMAVPPGSSSGRSAVP